MVVNTHFHSQNLKKRGNICMNKVIIYDFDGTLTPYPMPKFEILELCGLKGGASNLEFVRQVKERKHVEFVRACYEVYLETILKAGFPLTDATFIKGAETVALNEGVLDCLSYLKENNVKNYVLSAGVKVYLEHTPVIKYLEDIYASTFAYENGIAKDVGYCLTEKKKVDAIQEIMTQNNMLDCSNVIYIGDGMTDFYAMEYVHNHHGISILVNDKKEILKEMEHIVDYCFLPDFSLQSDLVQRINQVFQLK